MGNKYSGLLRGLNLPSLPIYSGPISLIFSISPVLVHPVKHSHT
jgi:hypothetical protein